MIQWLSELDIVVELPEEYGESSEVDAYVDHQSLNVINKEMFQTKEDLLTYLFNNDIVIYIENDNSCVMQNWVDTPKKEIDYRQAMYWCVSQSKCVRRKSWNDGVYLIYDVVEDDENHYRLEYLLVDNKIKTNYKPTEDDKNANDWTVALEVNKYEINS